MYPRKLNELIEMFRILPGVGIKTAERYALIMLEQSQETIDDFAKALIDAKAAIHPCPICFNLTDEATCTVCSDPLRNRNIICVVSDAKEVFSIEKMNHYTGTYHVLEGLISTQKGIMPNDLRIDELVARLSTSTEEVILALNATVEGEMTALYLAKKLDGKVNVSRLAFGLSTGGNLDYADHMTLMKAFEGRNPVK